MNLVYSTKHGGQIPRCKKCRRAPCACKQAEFVDPANVRARVKLEVRKGKPVTVVSDLPNNPGFFKGIVKELKKKLSCGGAAKEGRIELQGDHREAVYEFFSAAGYGVRHG